MSFFQYEGMRKSEQIIDYAKVIAYVFTRYSLKRGLKEIGAKGDTVGAKYLY